MVNKFIGENMIYDIANLKVEIKNENGRTEKQAIPYLAQNQDEKNIDITIDVDEKRVLQAMKEHPELVQDDWEYILNDDKPAIRLIDGKVYACGTPWSGKYDYSTPKIVELAGICFLQRSETNWIKKAETGKAVFNIFSQTVHKISASRMESLFDVLEQIFAKVPIYDFGCNISDEAVLTSYNAMKPKNKKEVKV